MQLIPAVSIQKVLFAYDVEMEQAGSVRPCYPGALTQFKPLTQTILSTFPQLLQFSDKMKKTVLSQRRSEKKVQIYKMLLLNREEKVYTYSYHAD